MQDRRAILSLLSLGSTVLMPPPASNRFRYHHRTQTIHDCFEPARSNITKSLCSTIMMTNTSPALIEPDTSLPFDTNEEQREMVSG